jgi:hypothetical protein
MTDPKSNIDPVNYLPILGDVTFHIIAGSEEPRYSAPVELGFQLLLGCVDPGQVGQPCDRGPRSPCIPIPYL